MPASMTTTAGTATIRRTHVQQLIDAWNGLSSVPLVLNGQGTEYTPLTIKANAVSPSFVVLNTAGNTIFSIGANGVITPSVGVQRAIIMPQQMTASHTVSSPQAGQWYAATYVATSSQVGTAGTNVPKSEWRFPPNHTGATTFGVTAAGAALVVGDTYKVVSLGTTTNAEWLALAGYTGTVSVGGAGVATTTPTFAVNSGFTAALTGIGAGTGTVQRVDTTVFASVPLPTEWKAGNVRLRLFYRTEATLGALTRIAWTVKRFFPIVEGTAFPTAFTEIALPTTIANVAHQLRVAETTFAVPATPATTVITVPGAAEGAPVYAQIMDLAITRSASSDMTLDAAHLHMVTVEFGV